MTSREDAVDIGMCQEYLPQVKGVPDEASMGTFIPSAGIEMWRGFLVEPWEYKLSVLKQAGATDLSKVFDSKDRGIVLSRLGDIDDPKYAGGLVTVRAVVSTSAISYNVPKALYVTCSRRDDHECGNEQRVWLAPDQISQYPDRRDRSSLSAKFAAAAFPNCKLWVVEMTDVVYRVRVRPRVASLISLEGKVVDEESGVEYRSYDIYILGRHEPLEPGSVYEITGTVIPDPRTQKITLFVTSLCKDASSEYDMDKIRELSAHLSGMSVSQRADWLVDNFQKYSKIRKREDLMLASYLAFFSPTYIEFDGKHERGWLIVAEIGDSTTAKSEANKCMIRLTGGGQYVTAETASAVGLGGAAINTTNGWFVDWGALPANNEGLLVTDGAQKLPMDSWADSAESQRTGTVKIMKAAKAEAAARTRQILIANPVKREGYERSSTEMSAFLHSYMALPTVWEIQNIARLDLAVYVSARDVTAEDVNVSLKAEPDSYLANLKDLRAFVWAGKYKVQYGADFVAVVHKHATDLYNKFYVNNVPLVPIDMRFKLARLSTALALATCSFNEALDTVVVTKDHVDFVAKFIDDVYARAGLHQGSSNDKQGAVDRAQVEEIIDAVCKKTDLDRSRVVEIVNWAALQASFSADQLKTKFDLSEKGELKPLIATLQSEQIISRHRGFTMTAKGIGLVRLLASETQCHICNAKLPADELQDHLTNIHSQNRLD